MTADMTGYDDDMSGHDVDMTRYDDDMSSHVGDMTADVSVIAVDENFINESPRALASNNSGDGVWSAPRRLRPPESTFEAGEGGRKLLGVRACHVLELAREHFIDGRLVPAGEPAEHVALIARNARPQLHESDGFRKHPRCIGSERLLDLRLRPDPHRHRDHLLARNPLPDPGRYRYNRPVGDLLLQRLEGHPKETGSVDESHIRSRRLLVTGHIWSVRTANLSRGDSCLSETTRTEGEIFGLHLRELRTKRGLTQTELAESSRTAPAFISKLERGVTTPTLGMLIRLADVSIATSPIS